MEFFTNGDFQRILIAIMVCILIYGLISRMIDFIVLQWLGRDYQKYKILLRGRFFAIKIIGKYRRDLETNNWHYYEDRKGKIWHFRKENIQGVYGDTALSVLNNQIKKI